MYPRYDYPNIRNNDCGQTEQAENLLFQHPAFFILRALQEKIPKRILHRLLIQAVDNFFVIRIRSEPDLVRVEEKDQTEQQKNKNKKERWLRHVESSLFSNREER